MSVRYALLALLSEGPKYGPQLCEELETWAGAAWPLNEGQVDATLRRLEREGQVESGAAGADGPQEGFRLTPCGEQELGRWLRTPPKLAFRSHDELATKILIALRVPGTDVHEVIQVHRRYRSVMADLPEPAHAPQSGRRPPPAAMPRPVLGLRSPLVLLLAALAMLGALLIPGGWPFIAFLEAVLVTALMAGAAAMLAAARFQRRMRRH